MIEWLIGAAVFGLVGELFGASRRPSSVPSYQPVTTRPKFTLTPKVAEEQKPETPWDVAKFLELSAALDWLESPPRYPAACVMPPILSEAAKYRGFLKQELARVEGMIADKSVCERINDFLKDPKLAREGAIAAHLESELAHWAAFSTASSLSHSRQNSGAPCSAKKTPPLFWLVRGQARQAS